MNLAALNSLPSAFWAIAGSVITGIVSLIGIYLTNRANTKRQENERKMALRREVYLRAAEAVSALQSQLGRLIDPSKPVASEAATAELAMIAQVYLIGGGETVKAVMSFVTQFNAVYAGVMLERAALNARRDQLTPNGVAREWLTYARAFKVDCFTVAKLTGPCILALRRELGLEIDESMMLSLMDEGIQKSIAVIDNFLDETEKHLLADERVAS